MSESNENINSIDVEKELKALQDGTSTDNKPESNAVKEDKDSIWKTEDYEEKTEEIEKAAKETEKGQYANKPSKISNEILTIDPNEVFVMPNTKEELWHEIKTAHIKGTVLRGTLDEVSRTPNGVDIAVTYYKGQRIIIPLKELGLQLSTSKKFSEEPIEVRLTKIATTMIGAEIDFIIRSFDKKNGVVLASRKDAILEQIKKHYATLDDEKTSRVARQPKVQARIIAVGKGHDNKYIKVDVLGVVTQLNAWAVLPNFTKDLDSIFSVGDRILVNVTDIEYPEPFEGCEKDENWLTGIKIKAEHRSFEPNTPELHFDDLIPGKTTITGVVTDYHNGVYFLSLKNFVNAIAHNKCDRRTPMVGDIIKFTCLKKDDNTKVAIGIIRDVVKSEY